MNLYTLPRIHAMLGSKCSQNPCIFSFLLEFENHNLFSIHHYYLWLYFRKNKHREVILQLQKL